MLAATMLSSFSWSVPPLEDQNDFGFWLWQGQNPISDRKLDHMSAGESPPGAPGATACPSMRSARRSGVAFMRAVMPRG